MFRAAGYKIWKCSSMNQNLVSEVIVDGIIKGLPDKADIAILELPHGTAGLMGELKLKVGHYLMFMKNIYQNLEGQWKNTSRKCSLQNTVKN